MAIQLITALDNSLKKQFPDLVKNFDIFHNKFTEEDFLNQDTFSPVWEDHSSNGYYNHHIHIDDLLSKDLIDEDLEKNYVVRVPISYLFSSESSQGGCDRPLWTSQQGEDQCRKNLNQLNGNGLPKGYRPEDAEILSAYLRPCGNGKYIVVKYIGNNRLWMKLLVNKGEDSEVLVSIRFHKEGDLSDYLSKEAERHSADAGDRSGQNEEQKFTSNYRAGRKGAVDCFNYLRDHQLDYKNIMVLEGYRPPNPTIPAKPWLGISSLQGIKEGLGNGYFRRYGEDSVNASIEIIKGVTDITGEQYVASTPIECIAQMHHVFTKWGILENGAPIFKPQEKEIESFFIRFFAMKNQQASDPMMAKSQKFNLSDLNLTGGVKDITYINAMTFWPYIVEFHKNLNVKKNGFGLESQAVKKFLSYCKDKLLEREIKIKLASS